MTERALASVSVTWYGQSGFRLAAGDQRVLIDPFLSDHPDRNFPPPASAAEFTDVTLVLSTHEHVDHLDLPFLREFCAVNARAPIVVPAPVMTIAAGAGIDRTLSALAPDVLMLPINGRDHMRESAGIVGNMNETEAAWLCAQVEASYVIPMHYDAIRDNTGDPGHFADLVRQGGSAAAVIMPARGRPVTLTLP